MKYQIELLSNVTTTIDGEWTDLRGVGDGTTLCTAYLGAGGGTATCTVEGRMFGAPWPATPLVSFSLSGANDQASYILDKEKWFEIRGRITAIGGGATMVPDGIYA